MSLCLGIVYARYLISRPAYICVLLFTFSLFDITPWLFLGCRDSCVWGDSYADIRKCPDCVDIVSWPDLTALDNSG